MYYINSSSKKQSFPNIKNVKLCFILLQILQLFDRKRTTNAILSVFDDCYRKNPAFLYSRLKI